jgi:hypothetical protein
MRRVSVGAVRAKRFSIVETIANRVHWAHCAKATTAGIQLEYADTVRMNVGYLDLSDSMSDVQPARHCQHEGCTTIRTSPTNSGRLKRACFSALLCKEVGAGALYEICEMLSLEVR